MDLPPYTPRLGFWIATIFVISVTIFPLILLGVFSDVVDASAPEILNNFGLLMISSSCVALLQTLLLVSRSLQERAQWFGITVAGTAIGWGIVFALSPLLGELQPSSPSSKQLIIVVLHGIR